MKRPPTFSLAGLLLLATASQILFATAHYPQWPTQTIFPPKPRRIYLDKAFRFETLMTRYTLESLPWMLPGRNSQTLNPNSIMLFDEEISIFPFVEGPFREYFITKISVK